MWIYWGKNTLEMNTLEDIPTIRYIYLIAFISLKYSENWK